MHAGLELSRSLRDTTAISSRTNDDFLDRLALPFQDGACASSLIICFVFRVDAIGITGVALSFARVCL